MKKETIIPKLLFFVKYFVIGIIIGLFAVYPLPYYVTTGGGVTNLSNRITIEGYETKKSNFYLAHVSQLSGTPLSFLLSYVIPSWELESIDLYKYEKKETMLDVEIRGRLYFEEAYSVAVKNSFEAANKTYKTNGQKHFIISTLDEIETDLSTGDELLAYDGIKYDSHEKFAEYIFSKKAGDKIKIKYKTTAGKTLETSQAVLKGKKHNYIGILIFSMDDYETEPKITFKENASESGGSGGLTLALDIYDILTDYKLSNGRKIVGTGSLAPDGTVIPIDGVEHKLSAAIKAKADIFIVPNGENYKLALKEAKKKKSKIKIIAVDTFTEAIEKLSLK